tara:strand:+ start:125 stop:394 length:270 start_codon:yes stop_codon:yes gene_type:complete
LSLEGVNSDTHIESDSFILSAGMAAFELESEKRAREMNQVFFLIYFSSLEKSRKTSNLPDRADNVFQITLLSAGCVEEVFSLDIIYDIL